MICQLEGSAPCARQCPGRLWGCPRADLKRPDKRSGIWERFGEFGVLQWEGCRRTDDHVTENGTGNSILLRFVVAYVILTR
jgi:hypothetical protein